MNALTLLSFVTEMFSLSGKKMVDKIKGFAFGLFVCLFLGGSGGCAIAIVALVSINEDHDHSVKYTPTLTLYTTTHHHSRRGYAAEKHSVYLDRYCLN
jgi:hypothetical protein